ncbi:MAG: HAD family phosphatase [Nitrospirae bacterium]|nr:HAD family phosphatase [Nitrospirota bacterium]
MNTLSAIIFDFDGVIADSEPLHFAGFRLTLAEIGISLTESDYYANYLGYDDRGCFIAALTAHQRPADPSVLAPLMQRKAQAYLESVKDHLVIFPGVREFVSEAAATYPLAIASGALRHEIEFILEQAGLRKAFLHITGAEDVTKGKPDPEPFLHALAALNRQRPNQTIAPDSCLVIEDSIPGLRGAKAAGMKVLAVANTHTIQDLHEAHAVAQSLSQIRLSELRERLWPQT